MLRPMLNSLKKTSLSDNIKTGKIILNEKEKEMREVLLKVVEFIHQKDPNLPKINLRIAGGWVRDKVIKC
jgi:hypothetical protein